MAMENNPIEQLFLEIEKLKRTKQNNIPIGGDSMILTRGNIDGEPLVLYRKDVINEASCGITNIPSEVAVVKYIADKNQIQTQQFKCALNKVSSDIKSIIDAEVNRAMVAETELKTMIQVINIDALKQMIVDETHRATNVEQQLSDKIKAEKERAVEAEKSINASLDAEVNRASTKEGELLHAIGDETTRAKSAEKTLSNQIDKLNLDITTTKNDISTEENRAVSAENALNTKIDAAIQTSNEKYGHLRTDLGNEISRASAAEAAAISAINAEITRAKSEEHRIELLIKGIDYDEEFQALKEHVNVTEGILSKRIDDEINRATDAESNLQTNLNSEIERASRADERAISEIESLKEIVNDEIKRSTSKDDEFEGRLSTEITRATTAEDNLYKTISEVADKANDTDKETIKKLAEFNEKLNTAITSLNAADTEINSRIDAERDRAIAAETKNATSIDAEITRAKDAEEDIHRTVVDEIERSIAEDKRIEMLHQHDVEKINEANNTLNEKIENEIKRATAAEAELDLTLDLIDETKVDKSVAGDDALIVKDINFNLADSDHCNSNIKQIEFHKRLLNIVNGETTDIKEVYDLSIISGANDIALALEAETTRAIAAEQHLHDLIDRGISDNAVAKDIYANNNYRSVSSHDFNVDPSIFGSMFWTKTVTKDVRDPAIESVKEFHFVSNDIDVDVTHVTKDASIINLRVNKASDAEVDNMLKSVFGF